MRPSSIFFILLVLLVGVDVVLFCSNQQQGVDVKGLDILTRSLRLSDLCLSTEARYTRHLSLSDPVAPFMDHPGGFEHFPSGSFYGVTR